MRSLKYYDKLGQRVAVMMRGNLSGFIYDEDGNLVLRGWVNCFVVGDASRCFSYIQRAIFAGIAVWRIKGSDCAAVKLNAPVSRVIWNMSWKR